jgi:hypothetical protein
MSVSFRTRPSSPELTSEHFVCMLCEMWGGAIERFVERQAVCKLGTSKMTFTWIRKSLDCRSLGGDVADEDSHVIDCAPSRSIHGLFVMLAFLHQHERWQLLLVSFFTFIQHDSTTSYKGKTEHPGAYIPTRFASLPTSSWCSLQTRSDFPLYGVAPSLTRCHRYCWRQNSMAVFHLWAPKLSR